MPSSACSGSARYLHSFPTRRSSDLTPQPENSMSPSRIAGLALTIVILASCVDKPDHGPAHITGSTTSITSGASWYASPNGSWGAAGDRKSTRLNSSHVSISYAVFCLLRQRSISTLFPYTTLFRSNASTGEQHVSLANCGSRSNHRHTRQLCGQTRSRPGPHYWFDNVDHVWGKLVR